MFDLLTPIKQAQQNDILTLKNITKLEGYIIDGRTPLYFQRLNDDYQTVMVSCDPAGIKLINIPLRAIKQIITPSGFFVFRADPRDVVYGR